MKIKLQYAGGLEAAKFVTRLPNVNEVYEGELVDIVTPYSPPRGGYDALVILKRLPAKD